jgi:hypothetical protein
VSPRGQTREKSKNASPGADSRSRSFGDAPHIHARARVLTARDRRDAHARRAHRVRSPRGREDASARRADVG